MVISSPGRELLPSLLGFFHSPTMNWKKWPKLLEDQWEILGNGYKGLLGLLKLSESHLDWGCAIADFEDECCEEVEGAIRQFASTGNWPVLSPIGLIITHIFFWGDLPLKIAGINRWCLVWFLLLGEKVRMRESQPLFNFRFVVRDWTALIPTFS